MEENKNVNKQPLDPHENVPRTPKEPKKKKGVSVPLVIGLVVVVIAAGLAGGYFIGRNSLGKDTKDQPETLEVTNVESVPIVGVPEQEDQDVFAQELNGSNDTALESLTGNDIVEDTAAVLQGDTEFGTSDMEIAEDDSTVVAEYDGGKLYRGEVAEEYNSLLAAYMFAGYSEEDLPASLIQETMESMISDKLIAQHAKEMGLDQLTDEERAELEKTASTDYAEQISFYVDFVREDGMTDEQALAEAEQFLNEYEGINYDGIYQEAVQQAVQDKLYEEVTKDVTVTEEDVRAAYDDAIALQKTSYAESAENYELDQLSGAIIVYNLDGYRAVKILSVYFDDDTLLTIMDLQSELSELNSDDARAAEINAQLETCYTRCEATAQAALDELNAGSDFDTVYKKYSTDLEYLPATVIENGNYIATGSALYEEDVVSAAMNLANPGDISGIVRTENGVCILKYIAPVTPGEVSYDVVHDALSEQTLNNAKAQKFSETCESWVAEVNPVYYTDRMY